MSISQGLLDRVVYSALIRERLHLFSWLSNLVHYSLEGSLIYSSGYTSSKKASRIYSHLNYITFLYLLLSEF